MTTLPTPCDRLDAYLQGRLDADAEAAFERHLDACDGCLDAVAPGEAEAAVFAAMAEVTCPPAVFEAARAQARRAGDRRAVPGRRRLRRTYAWAGLVALLAVAASVLWLSAPEADPLVAEAPEPPSVLLPSPEPAMPAEPEPPPTPEAAPPPASPTAPARPTPPAAGPDRTPDPPSPEPVSPAPEAVPTPDLAAAPDSVAIAREEVLLALAIVSDAQDRAAYAVADGVGRVSDALHASPPLSPPQTP